MLQNPLVGDETFEVDELHRRAAKMRTINGRVRQLEDQLWIGNGRQRILLILCHAGWGLRLLVHGEAREELPANVDRRRSVDPF